MQFDLRSFWEWYASDLMSNTTRGVLAEYLVACALDVADGIRVEWDAYDLTTKSGIKVEVKSAALIQSWYQDVYSKIEFNATPTLPWYRKTGKYGTDRKRHSDVYVFAVLNHQEQDTVDPLNVDQWDFYVLSTATLNEQAGEGRGLTIPRLLRYGAVKAGFGELADLIEAHGCLHTPTATTK